MLRATFVASVLGLFAIGCESNPLGPTVESRDTSQLDTAQLARSREAAQPQSQSIGEIETVASLSGQMPTGIAVTPAGEKPSRIFVCYPRWGDNVDFTVAEIIDGKPVPYPDAEFNKLNTEKPADCLVSVQSVVVDSENRLWVLDTGRVNFEPPASTGAKLLAYDLTTNVIVRRIEFPNSLLSTTYLNDVRFNLKLGEAGAAFITDSSDQGPNAIIVVDLKSGKSWRRLEEHPSTTADKGFVPSVEGQPLMVREPGKPERSIRIGADGIAISPDGKTLYFSPLASHRLYSVSTEALAQPDAMDAYIGEAVKRLPDRNYASDGLACDPQGYLYLTDYEHNAIHRQNADGRGDRIIAQDARMVWPDTLSYADGYLYFTCNQLNRQARFHEGKDLRQPPFTIFRTRLEGATSASADWRQ